MEIHQITDFNAPELDIYARLTENQLVNRADPENALFVAESPLVIGRALDAGCAPVSFLMETKHVTGKGAALLALAEKFGVMPSETMSFGDSGNDISMIEAAGVGVVMDNARDEIKAHADLIAPSNQDEGVAQIIEKYVLEGDKA